MFRHLLGISADLFQVVLALLAVGILTLDSLGFTNAPWLRQNLTQIIFVGLCTLIIASVIERRSVIKEFHDATNERLDQLTSKMQIVEETVSGRLSADLFLKDRSQYGSIEDRTDKAKEVAIVGKSLVGFVNLYEKNIRLRAEHGCKWRFVITDPAIIVNDDRLLTDIEVALVRLTHLRETFPNTIEIRMSKSVLNASFIAVDYRTRNGLIQVELYSSARGVNIRPHFDLRPTNEPRWYKYYRDMVDRIWEQSEPYLHTLVSENLIGDIVDGTTVNRGHEHQRA